MLFLLTMGSVQMTLVFFSPLPRKNNSSACCTNGDGLNFKKICRWALRLLSSHLTVMQQRWHSSQHLVARKKISVEMRWKDPFKEERSIYYPLATAEKFIFSSFFLFSKVASVGRKSGRGTWWRPPRPKKKKEEKQLHSSSSMIRKV